MYLTAATALYLINNYTPAGQSSVEVVDHLKPFDNLIPDKASLQEGSSYYSYSKNAMAYHSSSGIQTGFIGTTGGFNCDTCSIKWIATHSDTDSRHRKYYITLPLWKIKNTTSIFWYTDSVKFHTENDQNYLRKVVTAQNKGNKHQTNYVADVPVKFAYDQTNQYLLIPVTKTTKNNIEIVLRIFGFALLAYLAYLIISFLNFIVDLSKGLAFTDKNIARLKLIAITLILYPFALFLLNQLMRVVFYNYFTSDVIMNKSVWQNSLEPIGIGLVFFLLYRAFAQGKSLKDEHDLTV
ncbi:DUF2975 domain-containing protein [Mucilaginibacter corticis]|nr:DUF2975 domain-containing protein [Mucilaginibacter corticis]